MKVKNMTSSKGNKIANQFVITEYPEHGENAGRYCGHGFVYFQSYDSIIVKLEDGKTYLDRNKWDYSATTGRYRNQFLGETKAETQRKIDSGEYTLTNLN